MEKSSYHKRATRYTAVFLIMLSLSFASCTTKEKDYDATGSFEAIERTISAQATGKIESLNIEEGMTLKAGQVIGQIDITNLSIQKEQLESSINAIYKKTTDPQTQILVLEQELKNIEFEIQRFEKLVATNTVPSKQLDDLKARKLSLQQQLKATISNTKNHNDAVLSEVSPNQKRVKLIEEQIKDGTIVNEFDGTVTSQLAYDGEFTAMGRPLYRIADLENIVLRVYITGSQLPKVRLGDEVTVRTDDGNGGYTEAPGTISWISSKAEFTPKTIQTKDERANMVYAVKVKVKNNGLYKIGMYGQINFK